LSICSQLVERMGGAIRLRSSPGIGSVFSFTIVAEAAAEPKPNPNPNPVQHAKEPRGAIRTATQALCALVVDDNAVNRRVAGAMLEKDGLQVSYAQNGAEAHERLAQQHYDLTLLDCQMRVMDGYEMIATLRQQEQHGGSARATVVGLTASAMAGDQEACLAAGMDDYLAKPLEWANLRAVLARWVPDFERHAPAATQTRESTEEAGISAATQ
jgi:CheY-like chemotaxis protein